MKKAQLGSTQKQSSVGEVSPQAEARREKGFVPTNTGQTFDFTIPEQGDFVQIP